MNTLQRIVKNTGVFFFAQVLTYIFAFFYTIYTARYLGAEGFGILTFAFSFVLIMGISADLGLSPLTVREVSRNKSLHSKYAGNILLIKIILSLVSILSIVIMINTQKYSSLTIQVVYILALWVVVNSFSQLFYSIFQAHEKLEYQSILSIINSIIILSGVFFGIIKEWDVLWFSLIYLLASIVVLVLCIGIYLAKFQSPLFEMNITFWKSTIITAIPLCVASIFSIIAFRVDSVLLSFIQGVTVVGYYNAAYKLIESLMFIPMVYTAAIFPVLSNYHLSSKKSLKLLYKKSVQYSIILGLPIAAGITIFAPEIINFLYGNAFNSSIIALQILIWTIPFLFLTFFFATLFISIDKQNLILKITCVTMVFNVILNLLLIPKYSYLAASLVTVLTEALGSLICIYFLSKYVAPIKFRKILFKPILATLIMSAFLFYKPNFNVIIIILAVLIYIILLIVFKTFQTEDYKLLAKIYK